MAHPPSLQHLCATALAKEYSSVRKIYEKKLPIPLQREIQAKYEENLHALSRIQESIVPFRQIEFCCRYMRNTTCLNEFKPGTITNGYFIDLYDKYIEEYTDESTYYGRTGYGYPVYAPKCIRFTTHSGDKYVIKYDAYTSTTEGTSNWDRLIDIERISYWKNDEGVKELPFVFIYDRGNKAHITISHIKLNWSMNYAGHSIIVEDDDDTGLTSINEKKFIAQLKMLRERQKTSTLPFFVLFLEHLEDPIMRLIYLFTYMPSMKVMSGK